MGLRSEIISISLSSLGVLLCISGLLYESNTTGAFMRAVLGALLAGVAVSIATVHRIRSTTSQTRHGGLVAWLPGIVSVAIAFPGLVILGYAVSQRPIDYQVGTIGLLVLALGCLALIPDSLRRATRNEAMAP